MVINHPNGLISDVRYGFHSMVGWGAADLGYRDRADQIQVACFGTDGLTIRNGAKPSAVNGLSR